MEKKILIQLQDIEYPAVHVQDNTQFYENYYAFREAAKKEMETDDKTE
ncbi:MAG: hypothetical protein WA125_02060 [Desulfosporosinus sp.]